ncbi:periplasmic binding protein-like II [Piromyces finnis]|uniref:Periplasmic binding protein-like II n=1 Tax=Piromyces finnis TaxID=1754191 RepID=A0A1Y1VAI7_9FUNG|nr:periplasmic binding protein-like II [Piromyces finnis]|eukprot:ORX50396.1 periplasmic binding protein-like II [Piromyces finnis]
MKLKIQYLFAFILLFSRIIRAISINIAVYSYLSYAQLHNEMVNEFNKYSKENNLDITLNLTLFSDENTTYAINDFGSTIEYLLKKKSRKYDLYIYDVIYTRKYANYLIDLKEYLPPEHINLYNSKDSQKVSVYNNRLVGLPIFLKYDGLYSNIEYLQKYNKNIPKTWDELIETGKYILEQEKMINENSQLIGYNGLFPNFENTMCSIYEFIYSFRDTPESPFPNFKSNNALEALNKLDKIKKEISSDQIFQANEGFNAFNIFNGDMLFFKFWDIEGIGLEKYRMTPLPGKNLETSGSCIGGYNIGIANFIKKENIEASIKVLQFFTSLKQQKNIIISRYKLFSGIKSLYQDKEVCSFINCDFIQNVQSIHRPSYEVDDYDSYSTKVMNYFFEFLYKGQSAEETLTKIDDITRIYYYDPLTKFGLIMISIITITVVVLLYTFIMIPIKKYEIFNNFFTNDQWVMYCSGTLLCLCSEYTKFGPLSNFKCQLGLSMLLFGITFNIIPILYKLIIHFPEKNEIKKWFVLNKNIFIMGIISVEVFLNGFLIYSPFSNDIRISCDNRNFNRCSMNSVFGDITMLSYSIIKVFLIIIILILIFIEWNIKSIYEDIRAILFTVYLESLVIILLIIINYIKLNNYNVFYTIHTFIVILYSLSNYIYVYILRIFIVSRKPSNNYQYKLKEVNYNDMEADTNNLNSNDDEENINNNYYINDHYIPHPNLFLRMISYHYNPNIIINSKSYNMTSSYDNITSSYSNSI